MPLVSVLLPNYNNGAYLQESIGTLLNQSFTDFEVIIVDDASADNSVEVIKSIKDQRIRLIQKETNSGIVDALNLAIENSTGKYMIRMDGDDLSLPGRFETLVTYMEQHPEVGVCSSKLQCFGARNNIVNANTNPKKLRAGLIHGVTTPHATCIYRKSFFDKHQVRYRNNFPHMEDYDLFFRIKNLTTYGHIPTIFYMYRIYDKNVTVLNKDKRRGTSIRFYGQVIEELGIEPSEENSLLHYEFFHKDTISFDVSEYYVHIKRLMKSNEKLKIYDPKTLRAELADFWNRFLCFYSSHRKLRLTSLTRYRMPLRMKTIYYLARQKTKR